MKTFARIARSNNQICNIWDEERPLFALSDNDPVFDVEITDHPQLTIIHTLHFYHSDGNFGEAPEGWVEPEPHLPIEEKLLQQINGLQSENQTLMLAIAEQYEKQLAAEENQQIIMMAIAELYETQTSATEK